MATIKQHPARTYREALDMTMVELAARADVSISTIQTLEAGGDCRLSSLRKIAEALGVHVTDLIVPGTRAS